MAREIALLTNPVSGGGRGPHSSGLVRARLEEADGILIPGGFGVRGIEGKIVASSIARDLKIPFLGVAVMLVALFLTLVFATNVAGQLILRLVLLMMMRITFVMLF